MPPASRRKARTAPRHRGTVEPGTPGVAPPAIPVGGATLPSTPTEPPAPGAPPTAFAAAAPSLPRFSEFVALLHHETQAVIEYLALPQAHEVGADAPSEALVKIERMKVEIPVRVLADTVAISKEDIGKLPILARPLPIPERPGWALLMRVEILSPKLEATTQKEGTLSVEFSVAAK